MQASWSDRHRPGERATRRSVVARTPSKPTVPCASKAVCSSDGMSQSVWKRYRSVAARDQSREAGIASISRANIALRRTLTSLTYSMHPMLGETDENWRECIDRTLASVRSHRRAAWARVTGKRHNESRQSRQRGTRQPIRASCESPSFDPRCRRSGARGERGPGTSPSARRALAGSCRSGARCRSRACRGPR